MEYTTMLALCINVADLAGLYSAWFDGWNSDQTQAYEELSERFGSMLAFHFSEDREKFLALLHSGNQTALALTPEKFIETLDRCISGEWR